MFGGVPKTKSFFLISHLVSDTHIGVRLKPNLHREVPHWGWRKALSNKDDSKPKGTRIRDLWLRMMVKDEGVLTTPPKSLFLSKNKYFEH